MDMFYTADEYADDDTTGSALDWAEQFWLYDDSDDLDTIPDDQPAT
jgi:hypothetical protein